MSNDPVGRGVDDHLCAQFFSHPDSPDSSRDEKIPRRLSDHLQTVAARSVWAFEGGRGSVPECTAPPTDPPQRTVYVSGWLHDIGKANPYFQRKLEIGTAAAADKGPPVRSMTYHARIGAFLSYYCLDVLDATELSKLAAYLAVAKHHGQLPDAADYISSTARDDNRAREALLSERTTDRTPDDLRQDGWVWAVIYLLDNREEEAFTAARQFVSQIISGLTNGAGSFAEFADEMNSGELQRSIYQSAARADMIQPDPTQLPDKLYDRALSVWSALTLADKTDVQGINNRLRAKHIQKKRVSNQIDALGGDEETALEERLNGLREEARKEVVKTGVPRLQDAESSIGEITLPTGLGKTLTGIEAALQLREQQATDDTDSRVVYALPYTSIIEQTREILERNSEEKIPGFGLSPFSKTYTIHHYRTDTVTTQTGEEPEDTASRPAVAVAEAWRAGFTLTTFAQLFESLTGPRGTQSMKLPALSNSVVILDEPQSVPYRWWGAAARLIRLLVEEFDATVLLMTATQPRLLDSEASLDTVSLVESPDAYLTEAQRVTYTLDETVREYAEGGGEPLGYDTAASRLLSQSTGPSRGSTLAVCNTVPSARDLYGTVCDAATANAGVVIDVGAELAAVRAEANQKDATDDSAVTDSLTDRIIREVRETEEAVVVGNLTSRHTPRDRRAVLDVAGELTTADVPFIFVTTQLVEAGVDVSFQSVYRDFAPLESIVQAAGRCNRSFEWGTTGGSVVVWRLAPSRSGLNNVDGNRRPPSELIYDRGQQRSLLRMVARTLIDHTESVLQFDEAVLSEETLEDYFSSVHDRNYSEQDIVRDIEQTQAQSLAETSFIDDENTQDVIVPKSEAERNSLRELQETDGESFPHQMEEYTDTRISLRVPKHRRAALAAATETLDDEGEVRVLTDLDSYTPAVGLRLSGSSNADDGD